MYGARLGGRHMLGGMTYVSRMQIAVQCALAVEARRGDVRGACPPQGVSFYCFVSILQYSNALLSLYCAPLQGQGSSARSHPNPLLPARSPARRRPPLALALAPQNTHTASAGRANK